MRYVVVTLIVATVLLLAALYLTDTPGDGRGPAGELQSIDEKVGAGPAAKAGDSVTVHYTGTFQDGKQFESSVGKDPYTFLLGNGDVIAGWDQGIVGMKVGGKRKLVIPYRLAYGERGDRAIPPRTDLTFVIELLAIK